MDRKLPLSRRRRPRRKAAGSGGAGVGAKAGDKRERFSTSISPLASSTVKQPEMAVQAAHLEADAFLVCLNHALSTEKEEVMGLCIGEVGGREGDREEPPEKKIASPLFTASSSADFLQIKPC